MKASRELDTLLAEKIEIPVYKWKVIPLPDIEVRMEDRPCLWYRMWMRIFFGWRVEAIVEEK